MRDHDQSSVVGAERGLQRFARGDVQVVRGLIEEDQVGTRPDQPCQPEPRALPAAQGAHAPEDLVAAEEEPAEKIADLDFVRRGPQVPERVQHGDLGWKIGGLLVQARLLHARAPLHRSSPRRQLAAEHAKERRLARSVPAHDPQAVPSHQIEVEPREEHPGSVAHRDPARRDHVRAGSRGAQPVEGRDRLCLPLRSRPHRPFALEALPPALGLLGVLPRDVLPDELFLAPALREIERVALGLLLHARPLLPREFGVVPRVLLQASVLDLGDGRADTVEEGAVVRDQHEGLAGAREKILQPFRGRHVQMVRGLVQKQEVRRGEDEPRDGDASLLAAAQGP